MNLKIVKFLLAHREVLLKVVELAKTYNPDGTWLEKWTVVDQIARLVLPVIEDTVSAKSLLEDFDSAAGCEADVTAMGIDWKLIVDVIVPILISILQAISNK
jgi:hypothetical protein